MVVAAVLVLVVVGVVVAMADGRGGVVGAVDFFG